MLSQVGHALSSYTGDGYNAGTGDERVPGQPPERRVLAFHFVHVCPPSLCSCGATVRGWQGWAEEAMRMLLGCYGVRKCVVGFLSMSVPLLSLFW